jgi:alpha-1,6-mannosyltransferase
MNLKPPRNSIRQRKGRILGLLAFLIVVGSLVLNTAMTIIATRASIANYPGGHALALFNKRYAESPNGKTFSLSYLTD